MSARPGHEPRATSNEEDGTTKPFRFKTEKEQKDLEEGSSRSSPKRRRHHHTARSRSHRSKRTKTSDLGDDPARYSDAMRHLGRDQAFSESLFDAMGDDEGAAFWEGVYGQPIHKYPNTYVNEATGELEQMDDEEYAQYVRRKMWEKSREGIEAAQEERRRQKAEEEAHRKTASRDQGADQGAEPNASNEAHNNFAFDFEIEASLRRGQRRKDQKRWRELWKDYLERWQELQTLANDTNRPADMENLFLRNKIAWPVESGKRKDVKPEEIEDFIRNGTEKSQAAHESSRDALAAALKVERVRWHPDKMQQRYGFMEVDETTMKGVTATFQVFDNMWHELRGSDKH